MTYYWSLIKTIALNLLSLEKITFRCGFWRQTDKLTDRHHQRVKLLSLSLAVALKVTVTLS